MNAELKKIKFGQHKNPTAKREFPEAVHSDIDDRASHRMLDQRARIAKPELASQGPRFVERGGNV